MNKYIDAEKLIAEIDGMLSACTKQTHTGVYNTCHRIKGIIASLLQEQPEGLHFTPLNRLIQKIPSEKWNDSTNNYAKKLRDCLIKEGYLKDANVLQGYISYMNGNNVPMATMDEQKPVNLNDDITLGLDRALQIIKDAKGILVGYQTDDGVYECDHAIQTLEGILKNGIEQQPAEWSEEDEKQLNDIIGLLPDLTIRHAWLLDIKQRLKSIPERFSLQPKQEQREVDLEKSIEFECIGKKVKMTVQELINHYIDSECRDVADECEF